MNETNFSYITPPSIAADANAVAVFNRVMEDLQEAYGKLAEIVPREDARYLLPNAVETKLVCTMNARSLYNFFRMRCCRRAQWEIRELASRMRELVRQ